MREVQLFIKPEGQTEYIKVDLFDDEVISLTQTIKNSQDVSKIFTDFSKSFTIPASRVNNNIFKHYYNYNIDNGFDGRKRVDARIEINRVPFKSGRVRLDGVQLKDDKAYAYKLTFFGNTIKLRDAIGEEKLSALDLDAYNTTYSSTDIKAGLLADPASNDVIVPLITHTERLTYGTGSVANSGDLKPYVGTFTGVLWSELKYAIRVDVIMQAIASRYGFTFSNDSFFKSANADYYNLFLWLHRKKGDVQSDILQDPFLSLVSGFTGNTDQNVFAWRNAAGTQIVLEDTRYMTEFSLRIDNPSATPFNISVRRDGEERLSRQNITAATTSLFLLPEARDGSDYEVYAYSPSSNNLTFTWTAVLEEPFNPADTITFSATQAIGSDAAFNISEQVPEMKVMDFMSGIFKMFNLVAEVDEQNVVTVKTLNNYYEEGVFRDITQYVDNATSDIDVAIPYSEISYKYKSSKTILADQYNQLKNKEWGADSYNTEDNLKEGGKFTVEIPFEHMQFERLTDVSTSSLTNVMYGYYVDDNLDPYIGSPLLFYPVLNPLSGSNISFVTGTDLEGNFNASETITTSINIPSNSVSLTGSGDVFDNIHFYLELNEYSVGTEFYETLFYNYHFHYIASLFNFRNRMTKVRALLPVPILINYSLADTFLIQGNRYRINSITTNLNTGESSLELLNVIPAFALEGAGSAGGSTGTGGGTVATLSATISGDTTPDEGTTVTYSGAATGTATGATTYEWSVSNGGTIVGSNTNQSVSITWAEVSENTLRTVTLTVRRNNDGNPKEFTTAPYSVTVQNTDTPPAPTPMSVDIFQSGGTPDSSVSEGAQRVYDAVLFGDYDTPVTYTWAADGGTITSGQGTNRVFVTWNEVESDYNGSISLTVVSNDGQTPPQKSYPVTVVNGTAAPYITPTITNIVTPVNLGFTTNYGVSIDSNIVTSNPTLYSWSITGGTINSGQLSDVVNVTWDTSGTGQISVNVVREGIGGSDTDNIEVVAKETTATITGDFSGAIEGTTRTYGSSIGGNTVGTIAYSWSVSKGEISGGSYDGSGNSVISGTNITSINVTWGVLDIGTGSVSLTATREGISGEDFRTLEVLGIYYVFNACDGGESVISRQVSDPPYCDVNGCRRYVDYSATPTEYYVYADATVNSPSGFTVISLQPVSEGGNPTFGCPSSGPPAPSEIYLDGVPDVNPSGESGVVCSIATVPNTVQWQLSKTNLAGYNPVPLTFAGSTSGTGSGNFSVNYGAYNGNGTETLRSVITATELNPAFGNSAAFGNIVISQSPPPSASLNVYARANLVPANRTFSYSTGGSYFTIANANIGTGCGFIGTINNLAVGATVTIVTSPTNQILGSNSTSCPPDFTSPSGTSYSLTVYEGTNNVALNVDTVAGVYALIVAKSLIDGQTACDRYSEGSLGTSYFDEASLFGSNAVFADVNGYSYAAASWFSDGLDFRYWNGTSFTSGGVCSGGNQP